MNNKHQSIVTHIAKNMVSLHGKNSYNLIREKKNYATEINVGPTGCSQDRNTSK